MEKPHEDMLLIIITQRVQIRARQPELINRDDSALQKKDIFPPCLVFGHPAVKYDMDLL
ncbi:hypothetical protein NQZ68_017490, partial [Dissostichus eleginoides]